MLESWPDDDVIRLARAYAADLETSVRLLQRDGTPGPAPGSLPECLRELAKRLEERNA